MWWLRAGVCAGVLVALVGCKTNLTVDLYASDVRDAATGTGGLTAPGTVAFQVLSTEQCAEHTAEVEELMAGVFAIAPRGCESVDLESFLLADVQVPVVSSDEAWRAADALFALRVDAVEGSQAVAVWLVMDRDKYALLGQRLRSKYFQSLDLAQSKVTLVVNNDERAPLRFRASDVFVNAEPVHGAREYELGRRHKAQVRLSDVGVSWLASTGAVAGFTLLEDAP